MGESEPVQPTLLPYQYNQLCSHKSWFMVHGTNYINPKGKQMRRCNYVSSRAVIFDDTQCRKANQIQLMHAIWFFCWCFEDIWRKHNDKNDLQLLKQTLVWQNRNGHGQYCLPFFTNLSWSEFISNGGNMPEGHYDHYDDCDDHGIETHTEQSVLCWYCHHDEDWDDHFDLYGCHLDNGVMRIRTTW